MESQILLQITSVIEKKMGKYKMPLNKETTLEKDLGISGDDAVEFILEFSKVFGVDISNFNIKKYFSPDGDFLLPAIIRNLLGNKREKQEELTIGDLEKAVVAGRLDEDVINN